MLLFKKWMQEYNKSTVYIFEMFKARQTIWYVIHADWMLLKMWPHLTFGWPFANISSTIHPTYGKLYIFVILMTKRVIWHTWKQCSSIFEIWPQNSLMRNPYLGGVKSLNILPKCIPTKNVLLTKNSFSPKCNIGTSLTVLFNWKMV